MNLDKKKNQKIGEYFFHIFRFLSTVFNKTYINN